MLLTVKEINFKKYRVLVLVKLNKNVLYSNKKFSNELLKIMPTLQYHKCKNNNDISFLKELSFTNYAHVFEHIAIDLQTKYMLEYKIGLDKSLLGMTKLDEINAKASIELSYWDDLIALKSISNAEKIINSLDWCAF